MYSAELTAPEVWSLILEETRKSINPQTFATWLEPTEAIALTSDELLVQVKSQFAVDYIGGQYGAVLAEISAALGMTWATTQRRRSGRTPHATARCRGSWDRDASRHGSG